MFQKQLMKLPDILLGEEIWLLWENWGKNLSCEYFILIVNEQGKKESITVKHMSKIVENFGRERFWDKFCLDWHLSKVKVSTHCIRHD